MKSERSLSSGLLAFVAAMALGTPVWAVTGVQIGASGKTYASAEVQCALNPITGMAPMVQAGLYNPKKNASATYSFDATLVISRSTQRLHSGCQGQCREWRFGIRSQW